MISASRLRAVSLRQRAASPAVASSRTLLARAREGPVALRQLRRHLSRSTFAAAPIDISALARPLRLALAPIGDSFVGNHSSRSGSSGSADEQLMARRRLAWAIHDAHAVDEACERRPQVGGSRALHRQRRVEVAALAVHAGVGAGVRAAVAVSRLLARLVLLCL